VAVGGAGVAGTSIESTGVLALAGDPIAEADGLSAMAPRG
jgi:hypothetical protein